MKKPAAQEQALPEQGNEKKPEQGNAGNGGLPAEGTLVKAEPKSPAKAPPVKLELVSPKKGASPKRATSAAAKAHPKIGQSEAKKMNQKLKALAKAGKTALPDAFAKCKSQAEKRQFFYEVYLLDPEISERRVAKTDVQAEEDRDDTQKGWFTDDEIAGFKGIFPHSSDYSSLKKACVQDLLEREHEDENLAKLGIKQYYFEHCKTFSSSSKKRELQLEENVGDVGQEDFEEIRKKLKGAATQKMISKGQSGRLPGEGKEKEAEVRIDHEQNYKDQRKKLTGQLTQVSTELATVELLKVSLDHKKHKMATVVLAQVAELESKFYSCKKEVMDSQHKFPTQPEKDHEKLASNLAEVVASISEKLKPLKRELSSHKKWDEENAACSFSQSPNSGAFSFDSGRAIAGPTKKRLRDEASDTSEEFTDYAMGLYGRNILCQPAQGSKTWIAAKEIKQKLGWGEEAVIPFALHGDGVPVQGTMRKEGLDFLTINLPAAQDAKHRSPVPFTLLQNDFHWEYETKDSILKVLLWSMQCLKEGKFPSCRHDGSPWLKSDKQRRTYVGRDLPAKGILVEIRGDWDWLNSWYNIPTYNTKSGMCWLCKTTFETFRNCTANERNSGLSKAEFLTRVRNMGKPVCPLWHWPELAPRTLILPDWLHAVDMGISADIAGQLLLELAAKYEGRSLKDRVSSLWLDVQELYKEHMVTDRLHKLTPEVLNKGKKSTGPPTLKCPAATVRHMMPLLPILTGKHFAVGSDHEVACHKLAKFLARVYNKVETNEHSGLDKASAKVASQYMALEKEALEAEDSLNWHIMPKLHQFQHICESGFNAKDFWCYSDETLGGHLAQLFLRRGGANNPGENCGEQPAPGSAPGALRLSIEGGTQGVLVNATLRVNGAVAPEASLPFLSLSGGTSGVQVLAPLLEQIAVGPPNGTVGTVIRNAAPTGEVQLLLDANNQTCVAELKALAGGGVQLNTFQQFISFNNTTGLANLAIEPNIGGSNDGEEELERPAQVGFERVRKKRAEESRLVARGAVTACLETRVDHPGSSAAQGGTVDCVGSLPPQGTHRAAL
ncbi:unnamed protein product [Symbiodinium sp. CCMP2592]|nr:unnamed protein product [Symbiodinium sp. CCMP2592]